MTTFLLTLNPGDEILLHYELYGGTRRILEEVTKKYGITPIYTDLSGDFENLINKNTKYVFAETPTNPLLSSIDIDRLSKITKTHNIGLVLDLTFSPPCTFRGFDAGGDVIIHSLSKYISGHNDVLGGAIIVKNQKLSEKIGFLQKSIGAVLSPDDSYSILKGLKTLDLRWRHVSKSALKIAMFLENHEKVKNVYYPGLITNKDYEIAIRQNSGGFGAVVSFEIYNNPKLFVETITKTHLISFAESLASPESILSYPYNMSHKSVPEAEKLRQGITSNLFRFSVGFEDPDDLIAEIDFALKASTAADINI